jgi:NAD(P)-dependent dehydrogenase (short-subunit alcohol dehydrogenase family)
LAEAGAEVVLLARTETEVEAAAAAIVAEGGAARGIVLDILETEPTRTALAEAGPFDILVNNAGTNRPKTMSEITPEDFDAVMDLNLRAAYFVSQTVTDAMIEAGNGGVVINISSQMGHVGGVLRTVYCSSKWALEGLTKAMALELAPHGIRVNSIAPTFIETPLAVKMLKDPEFKEAVLTKIKLGRTGTIEDLMGAILFLASDAAAMITGTSLLVDGGWTVD